MVAVMTTVVRLGMTGVGTVVPGVAGVINGAGTNKVSNVAVIREAITRTAATAIEVRHLRRRRSAQINYCSVLWASGCSALVSRPSRSFADAPWCIMGACLI